MDHPSEHTFFLMQDCMLIILGYIAVVPQ